MRLPISLASLLLAGLVSLPMAGVRATETPARFRVTAQAAAEPPALSRFRVQSQSAPYSEGTRFALLGVKNAELGSQCAQADELFSDGFEN